MAEHGTLGALQVHRVHKKETGEDWDCGPCRAIRLRYDKLAASSQLRVIYRIGKVDPTRAREHIASLAAWGMGRREIASRSGLGMHTITSVVAGKDPIVQKTEDKILAVFVPSVFQESDCCIGITGTRRRLEALVSIGYTPTHLKKLLGYNDDRIGRYLRKSRRITGAGAMKVQALYEQICMIPGPSDKARDTASALGYFPPLAWDEDTIDDPSAVPAKVEVGKPVEDRVLLERIEQALSVGDIKTAQDLTNSTHYRDRRAIRSYLISHGHSKWASELNNPEIRRDTRNRHKLITERT